jgi:class 3 adenylate cyclase
MHSAILGTPKALQTDIDNLIEKMPWRLEKSGLMWRQLAAVLVQRILNVDSSKLAENAGDVANEPLASTTPPNGTDGERSLATDQGEAPARPPAEQSGDSNSNGPVGGRHGPQDWVACQFALAAPTVIHFGGKMMELSEDVDRRFTEDHVAGAKERILQELKALRVGAGYGSLACGADILFAECLIEMGAELHVVLPFRKEDFIDTSVRRAGPEWIKKFDECLLRANTVTFATQDESLGDASLFGLGADVAIGMALRRSEVAGVRAFQCLVYGGTKEDFKKLMPVPSAGTVSLGMRWVQIPESVKNPWHDKRTDRDKTKESQVLIPPSPPGGERENKPTPVASPSNPLPTDGPGQGTGRQARALLFGDIKGYSKLSEDLVPKCVELVMWGLREVIKDMNKGQDPKNLEELSIQSWNTWGDAVYVVARTAKIGAECAMRMRKFIKDQDFERHGLPKDMTMRFGMHYGPVFPTNDPVHGTPTWFGSHVSKAARIEPVTALGEVFVSEPFACVLAVEASQEFACDYVGCMDAAKGYGAFRMFKLRRRTDEERKRLGVRKPDEVASAQQAGEAPLA